MNQILRTPPIGSNLHRLIFFSQAAALTGGELDRDLQDIVQASIRNNHDAAVTGFLVAHQGWFLQAMEGPKPAVTATFERICADPRHSAPKVIAARASEQRCFANWTLCARRLDADDAAMLKLFRMDQRFDPSRLNAKTALALLMSASQKPARAILWL